jgi:hypothetical protein
MLKTYIHISTVNSVFSFWLLPSLLLMLFLISCYRENAADLLQATGTKERIRREMAGNFNTISLNDNVDLVLTQGYPTLLELEGGSNLLSDITTEISGNTLTIRNGNKYNWVRSYKNKITVFLTTNNLRVIYYESSGNISTTDTIHEDSLRVEALGGSGTITMAVDCSTLFLVQQYGSMDFDISGKSGVTTIYAGSYGPFNCLGLKSYNTFIRSDGSNDCYVNAIERINAEIRSTGNIYYSGQGIANRVGPGSGKLIHVE